uniref:hypothetical protein n=1 Tax=Pseudonocardia pini TaxID=2758030 RepID=UPI0015F0CF2E
LVLLGAVGGYMATRTIGGQSPLSTVTVTTAADPTTVITDGWTVAVPADWERSDANGLARWLSPDGSEELALWRVPTVADVTAGFTAERLGVDAVTPGASGPVPGAQADAVESHYTSVLGDVSRTTTVRTVPVPAGVWAIALTVPTEHSGSRSEALATSIANSFTP